MFVNVVKSIVGAVAVFLMRTVASLTSAPDASTTCIESIPPPVDDSMLGGEKFEMRTADFTRSFMEYETATLPIL